MAESQQITCINRTYRPNAHDRIRSVGGVDADGTFWKLTHARAVAEVESGERNFFISVRGQFLKIVLGSSKLGTKYLKADGDGDHPESLLTLPECP